MRFDRGWIEAHIPHQGRMCLLDEVRAWDQAGVECASRTHRAPDHPLRAHGRLGSACLLEYAAQAMAVHGALRFPADAAAVARCPRRAGGCPRSAAPIPADHRGLTGFALISRRRVPVTMDR